MYIFGKYKYFDKLVLINKIFINIENNVRETEDKIAICNNLLQNFFHKVEMETDFDKIIELVLNLVGILWLYQPFYDGNTRTLLFFLKIFFESLGYDLIINNEVRLSLPIFYRENEYCHGSDILKIKERLKKIN